MAPDRQTVIAFWIVSQYSAMLINPIVQMKLHWNTWDFLLLVPWQKSQGKILYYCVVEKRSRTEKLPREQTSAVIISSAKYNSVLSNSLQLQLIHCLIHCNSIELAQFYCKACHIHVQKPEQIKRWQWKSRLCSKPLLGNVKKLCF